MIGNTNAGNSGLVRQGTLIDNGTKIAKNGVVAIYCYVSCPYYEGSGTVSNKVTVSNGKETKTLHSYSSSDSYQAAHTHEYMSYLNVKKNQTFSYSITGNQISARVRAILLTN